MKIVYLLSLPSDIIIIIIIIIIQDAMEYIGA